MEYFGTCEEIGLSSHLDWRPRETNTEADDLTNGRFEAFQDSRRIQVSWSDLDLPYIQSLMKHSESFSKRRPSEPLQHLSDGKFQKSKWAETTCFVGDMPAWFQFRGLHFYVHLFLISAWSQSLNFTWHPSNLRQKGSPHFSMLFALVCCDSCCRFQWCSRFHFPSRTRTPYRLAHRVPLLIWRLQIFIYAAMTQRVSFIYLALFVSSLLIDKPKLGSVATNRFVYRKLLGGLGGFLPCSLWRPPLGFVHGFWILHSKIYQPFRWEVAISKPWCSVCFSLLCVDFTFHFRYVVTCFKTRVFIVAAVTRSCLVSKLRFSLNSCDSKFPLYHSHVNADHFHYFVPRSLGSQSFCYPPSASFVSLSRFIATSFGSLRTLRTGGGYACVVSVSRFALLRGFVLISAWSQSLNFTWHPSNLRQKGSPHFSMLFALVCCDSCCRLQWCSHFHFRTALAHCVALINIWRL